MKKLVPFIMLLIFFSYACEKGTAPQTAEDQITVDKQNYTQLQVADRANCCCDVIVTSTYFEGMTICGVLLGDTCTVSSSCGDTCGGTQVVQSTTKTAQFCWDDSCPVCFRNDGTSEIKIKFSCAGGGSAEFPIPAGQWRCFTGDCNGNFTLCPP